MVPHRLMLIKAGTAPRIHIATRWELAKYAFVILCVGAVLGIVATEAFWRYLPACGAP